jgi:hypothetical protein
VVACHLLKPLIATYSNLRSGKVNEIVRAFQRFVEVGEDREMRVLGQSHEIEESELWRLVAENGQSFRDAEKVDSFVKEHWEGLKGRERERAKAGRGR